MVNTTWAHHEEWRPSALAPAGRPRRLQRAASKLRTQQAEVLELERRERETEARLQRERDQRRAELERIRARHAELERIGAESQIIRAREMEGARAPDSVLRSAAAICAVSGIEPSAVHRLLAEAYEHGRTDGARASAARIGGHPLAATPHPYRLDDPLCARGHDLHTLPGGGSACVRCGRRGVDLPDPDPEDPRASAWLAGWRACDEESGRQTSVQLGDPDENPDGPQNPYGTVTK